MRKEYEEINKNLGRGAHVSSVFLKQKSSPFTEIDSDKEKIEN